LLLEDGGEGGSDGFVRVYDGHDESVLHATSRGRGRAGVGLARCSHAWDSHWGWRSSILGIDCMISRRGFLSAGLWVEATVAITRRAGAGGKTEAVIPPLPLSIAVAEKGGAAVRGEAWIAEQLAEVDRLFLPLGLSIRKASSRVLPEGLAALETRGDRDELAKQLEAKRINVMIVESLRDVDDPKLFRMGVHWRHRKTPAKHYVIVAASARPSTLAHELGHFFGLSHSDVTDNLMSYSRTGAPPFLDAKQSERVLSMARMYVGSKLIEPV